MTSKWYNQFAEKLSKGEDLTEKELQNAIKNDWLFDINEEDEEGWTLCMRAAEKGKTGTVRLLLKDLKANVNAKDDNGWTACIMATVRGRTETVRVLVEELKADVNAKDDNGYTACMHAAIHDHTETLFELVRLGADISIETASGYTVFDYIDDDETKEKVIKLRAEYEENHPEAKKMAASFASRYFYDKFAKKLSNGEDLTKDELEKAIDRGFKVDKGYECGWTLCMLAAEKGKTDTVRILVNELKANVNARDIGDMTACTWAAFYGKTDTVRVLVEELKADVDAQDDFGGTACMWAARNDKTEALLELVRLGADISIKDNGRKTLFDYIRDDETKEKVIRLRREYEKNHPDKPKMADDLAKIYLPKVAEEPAFRGSHTAKRGGVKKAAARDNVPQK